MKRKDEMNDNSDVATGVYFDVISFLSLYNLHVMPETGIMRIKGPLKSVASF